MKRFIGLLTVIFMLAAAFLPPSHHVGQALASGGHGHSCHDTVPDRPDTPMPSGLDRLLCAMACACLPASMPVRAGLMRPVIYLQTVFADTFLKRQAEPDGPFRPPPAYS